MFSAILAVNMRIKLRTFVGLLFCTGLSWLLKTTPVQAATTTVCGSGCDFTSLADAIAAPPTAGDTIILSTGYLYASPPENTSQALPDDVTIQCDSGITYGDNNGLNTYIYPGSNNTIQNCHFENTSFDASGKTNVSWLHNTFSSSTPNQITVTNTSGFTIQENTGLQLLQNQNADNGLIDNNQFECRFNSSCLNLVTAGGGPFDYTNPTDVANNINITNNTFTNYNATTSGDFVHFAAGLNITFTSNTVQTAVQVNNQFIPLLTVDNAQATINNNHFFLPQRQIGDTSGIWAINIRVGEASPIVIAEHNAFINTTSTPSAISGNACLGVYDSGQSPGLKNISITFRYNLCYNGTGITGGTGMAFNYFATSSLINLNEEYNGFYNTSAILNDSTGAITGNATTDITSDPVLRRENSDSSDNYIPAPMSRYLDVNGSEDIGPYAISRLSTYTIDGNCTVDYVSCMSRNASIINQVAKNGDTIHVTAGTYPGLTLNGPLSNLTVQGDGISTIFDGSLNVSDALKLNGISSSTITNLRLTNTTDTTITSYFITKPILSFGGNDYDDSDAFGAPPNSVFLISDGTCNGALIQADHTDITSVITGTNALNAFLIDLGPSHVTVFTPSNTIDSIGSFTTACGIGPSLFIQDVFTPNGDGSYSFNAATLSGAGVSLASGVTNPARLDQQIDRGYRSGLHLNNASSNRLTNITIQNNDLGASFTGTSTGNLLTSSLFTGNTNADIVSNATGTNDLLNPSFNRTNSEIENGVVRVLFHSNTHVVNNLAAPLAGVTVQTLSHNGLVNVNETTDVNGYTPSTPKLAYLMTTSSLALTNGDYNPFTLSAMATGTYAAANATITLQSSSTHQLIMQDISSGGAGTSRSSGGAGNLTSILGNGNYAPLSTQMIINNRIHQLVKLADNGNKKTQEDSTVYYIGVDGKRHAFPNPSVYFSWYCDFSAVQIISASELTSFQLGGNITYKPGLQLAKFKSAPQVYVVQPGHQLQALASESMATRLFGDHWAKQVRDIEDTFYKDYSIGEELPATITIQALIQDPIYPSAELRLPGYQDIKTSGVSSNICKNPSMNPQSSTPSVASTKAWPFKNIPNNFNFKRNLDTRSLPSQDIRHLQEFLVWKGSTIYPNGKITGNFGKQTQQAIKNYQRSKGITPTGSLGPTTRAVINTELQALR